MSDDEPHVPHHSGFTTAALVIGIAVTLAPIFMVATSQEARLRILISLGVAQRGDRPSPDWQPPRILLLLGTTIANVVGLVLAIIARRRDGAANQIATAAACFNAAGIALNVATLWGIS